MEKKITQKPPTSVNSSLSDERRKADNSRNLQNRIDDQDADEVIRLNRFAFDEDLERKRAEIDLDGKENDLSIAGIQSSALNNKNILSERERVDSEQTEKREEEDRLRNRERIEKRLIAEAILINERRETDAKLSDERERFELESDIQSKLLSAERFSHNLTKTALITRDQFLAVVSHDLKNPLGSILMSAAVMRDELSREQDQGNDLLKYLEMIERNASSMDRMINDLLDVERMANSKLVLKLERYDICNLLHKCRDLFSHIVTDKSLSIETYSEAVFLDIEPDRILQVLSNLIGNALKFTPKGGSVDLSMQIKKTEIEISVKDNGPGIPENKRSKIFERFSQLGTNDRRGLGLGLFISKWIVKAHRGRIWVESGVGEGSIFSFTLPLPESPGEL